MVIMHSDEMHFSDTETGNVFMIIPTYDVDRHGWWVEQWSTHQDVSRMVLGKYETKDEAMDALGKLYDACVNRIPSFTMP